jgi:hypothetical protein
MMVKLLGYFPVVPPGLPVFPVLIGIPSNTVDIAEEAGGGRRSRRARCLLQRQF